MFVLYISLFFVKGMLLSSIFLRVSMKIRIFIKPK